MPGGDGTGPMGMGPMTGRAAGYCAGYPLPGFMNNWGIGRGFRGMGRGFGGGRRGWRNRFYATGLTGWQRAAWVPPVFATDRFAQVNPANPGFAPAVGKEQELEMLKQQAELLGGSLDEIKRRIEELQAQPQAQ